MKSLLTLLAATAVLATCVSAAPIGYSVSSNGNDHLYRIDLITGVATDLGQLSFGDAEGLELVNGTLYGIGGTISEFWNLTTPPGSLIGATGPRLGLDAGLGYNPVSGVMYNVQASGTGNSDLYRVDMATGAATLVGNGVYFGDNVAINGSGSAYAVDGVFQNTLYSINLSTGAATAIGGLGAGFYSVQVGSDFDSDGTLWALTSTGYIYSINTTTGAAALQAEVRLNSIEGAPLSGFEGLAIETSAAQVPEPATAVSIVAGLGALVFLRRRQAR